MSEQANKKNIISCVKGINPVAQTAFFSAIIVGLLAHGYAMTNHFLTYDSMWNLYSNQDMISSGRQFLQYACGIGSYFDLPWVNGLLSILYLAVTAMILTSIYEMKSKISGFLTGAFLVSFPAITSTFFYTFTIDGYMLAVLLSVLAFYIADRYKWGFAVSIPVLGISVGIYQSYISVTIMICITVLLIRILDNKISEIMNKAWRYVVMGAGAYLFYLVTLKIMLFLKGASLSGYQGSDAVTGVPLDVVKQGLIEAFRKFKSFALYENVLTTFDYMKIGVVIVATVAVGLYIYFFIKKKAYTNPVRIIGVLVLLALIPFGSTLAMIVSPNMMFHLLMRLPWVILFIFAIKLAEMFETKNKKKPIIPVNLAASVLLIWGFVVTANIGYFQMNERYEKTYATCVRMVDRLEQTPGYHTGDKVAILGGILNYDNFPPTDVTTEYLSGYFGVEGELCVNSTAKYAEFMAHYLGVEITTIPEEEEIEMTTREEFINMPNFPEKESIKKIDDVWVIRING